MADPIRDLFKLMPIRISENNNPELYRMYTSVMREDQVMKAFEQAIEFLLENGEVLDKENKAAWIKWNFIIPKLSNVDPLHFIAGGKFAPLPVDHDTASNLTSADIYSRLEPPIISTYQTTELESSSLRGGYNMYISLQSDKYNKTYTAKKVCAVAGFEEWENLAIGILADMIMGLKSLSFIAQVRNILELADEAVKGTDHLPDGGKTSITEYCDRLITRLQKNY